MKKRITLLLGILMIGCKTATPHSSDTKFKTVPRYALLKRIVEDPIRVKIEGHENAELFGLPPKVGLAQTPEEWIRFSVKTWVTALRTEFKTLKLYDTVQFVSSGRNDTKVFFSTSHGHSHALFGYTITMKHPHSYGILLHEFGHVFGLGDTYGGGIGFGKGSMGDHPDSVMGQSGRYDLTADDEQGIRYQFCRANPRLCDAEKYEYKHVGKKATRDQQTLTRAEGYIGMIQRKELTVEDAEYFVQGMIDSNSHLADQLRHILDRIRRTRR